ncbi:MAG: tRNA (adenosine(37)-N6)-threonylcarbamoyltransferase complex dimerization subunit type 1 TsaB [Acidobacteria bacterium]|nr:tRNA (adenosine(37)-N6)-threonylcarbamoyltransferase complex dimerization subunit type 1 TsaB [Acidobacteriota bacterium]
MLVLSLDTTTRAGSAALWRDGRTLEERVGDPARTHGQRLPRELLELLGSQHLELSDVDLYAVAAGPGSFTGLRVGIATIQGLAFASSRPVVAVSTLDALGLAGVRASGPAPGRLLIGAWMDALRDEVFSQLFEVTADRQAAVPDEGQLTSLEGPAVDRPVRTLDRWRQLAGDRPIGFIGEGALRYRDIIGGHFARQALITAAAPALAAVLAEIAARRAVAGEAVAPHAVRPVYVRRPDAEIARDRPKSTP